MHSKNRYIILIILGYKKRSVYSSSLVLTSYVGWGIQWQHRETCGYQPRFIAKVVEFSCVRNVSKKTWSRSDRQHPLKKHVGVSGMPTVDDRWIHALRSTIHDPWSWSMGGIHVREMRSWWSPVVLAGDHFSVNEVLRYRSLLASRSDSSKVRRSPSRTGPFTFLMICRFCSPKNSTFTWVHCPCEPVRPRTLITRAKTTGLSILIVSLTRGFWLERDTWRKWKKSENA